MKKKIAIVTNKFNIGGCEKALINMLKTINYDLYDVTIFVKEKGGILEKSIQNNVKVMEIPMASLSFTQIIKEYAKRKKYINLIKALYYRINMKLGDKEKYYFNYCKILPKIEGKYDLAISYYFPGEFVEWYTMNNIGSNKKIVWIHSDIDKINVLHNSTWKCLYSKYDKIICISEAVKQGFIRYNAECVNNTYVIYNYIDKNEIIKKGNESLELDTNFEGIKIITVGRLSREKGQLQIPSILEKLIKDNISVIWYCIGEGNLREQLEEKILELKLDGKLILLGAIENPYSYIKKCDIYVQPSLYEGFCLTLTEAKILNMPIITTDFAGAREQIENGVNGIITEVNKDKLYEAIKQLILQKDMQREFKNALKREYDSKIKYNIDIIKDLL